MSEQDKYKYCPTCSNALVLKEIEHHKVKYCDKFGFVFWNNPKPTTSVLIHKDNEILMLQRAEEPFKGFWVLPGGFVKYGESAEETIRRETKEELGASIHVKGIAGVYLIDNDPRGMHIDIIFHGVADDAITLSREDKSWAYFTKDHLPEKIAYKHREAINDWFTKGGQYS